MYRLSHIREEKPKILKQATSELLPGTKKTSNKFNEARRKKEIENRGMKRQHVTRFISQKRRRKRRELRGVHPGGKKIF